MCARQSSTSSDMVLLGSNSIRFCTVNSLPSLAFISATVSYRQPVYHPHLPLSSSSQDDRLSILQNHGVTCSDILHSDRSGERSQLKAFLPFFIIIQGRITNITYLLGMYTPGAGESLPASTPNTVFKPLNTYPLGKSSHESPTSQHKSCLTCSGILYECLDSLLLSWWVAFSAISSFF